MNDIIDIICLSEEDTQEMMEEFKKSNLFRAIQYGAEPHKVLNGEFADFSAIVTHDAMTRVVVEDVMNDELEFNDDLTLSCIGTNFPTGKLMLLKLCAEELSDSHKDYHVIMKFIEKIEKICDDITEKANEEMEE